MLNRDLIKIKEKYGEGMMHLCRKNFSTILGTPGLLFELLSSHFAYSKFLYKNNSMVRLELPELIKADRYFMYDNDSLKVLLVPKLRKVGIGFLTENNVLEYVEVDIEQMDGYVRCFDSIYVTVKKRVLKP